MWSKPKEGKSSSSSEGGFVILCGPSGVGKSSLIRELKATYGKHKVSSTVSYTTRSPRPGEVNGRDYHFVSVKRFEQLKNQNFFVEWASVYHHLYGTSSLQIQELWKRGQVVVKDLDFQGASRMKRVFPDCVRIFILPPSVQDLRERVKGSRTLNQEVQERIRQARGEMARAREFDHQVMNRDFAQTLQELKKIIETRYPSVINRDLVSKTQT